jgi:hypothetical protein
MRSTLILMAVVLLAAAEASAGTPVLRIGKGDPLVVNGSGFQTGERVTVTVLTRLGPRVVRLSAIGGRFRVAVPRAGQPCAAPFAIRARGALGSSAFLMLPTKPCVPPPRD